MRDLTATTSYKKKKYKKIKAYKKSLQKEPRLKTRIKTN